MQQIITAIVSVYIISITFSPFYSWKSYLRIWKSILFENNKTIGIRTKLHHISFLVKDLCLIPLWTFCWYLDELIYPEYKKVNIKGILLLVGQPRSGTTFLHRTMSNDDENFTGIRHYEWRYPFLCFETLISVLGIKPWLETRNYWPNNRFGQTASRMHPHSLGDFEEDGVFFEERFWHHYFIFRRFPYPGMMPYIASYSSSTLSCKEREKMMNSHKKAIQKVIYKRGSDKYILLKENESIELIKLYMNYYPIIGIIGIIRPSNEVIRSYDALSRFSSMAKGNPDPISIPMWRKANFAHREKECSQMYSFLTQHEKTNAMPILTIPFRFTVRTPKQIVEDIYLTFDLELNNKFILYLTELNKSQRQRKSGYALHDIKVDLNCVLFDEWVRMVEQRMMILEKSVSDTHTHSTGEENTQSLK